MRPLLMALREWRAEQIADIAFVTDLDRGERATQPVKPYSQLSLKVDSKEGRAGQAYTVTERLVSKELVSFDVYDMIAELEALDGKADYVHGAAIWSHQMRPELTRIGSAGYTEAVIVWTGRATWEFAPPEARLWPVNGSQFSGTLADSWAWDFGDGHTSTVQNPVHLLAAASTVTLVARNRAGRSTFARVVTP